jgi:hypothetical protein
MKRNVANPPLVAAEAVARILLVEQCAKTIR